jgi:hypothetical protein
MAMLETFRKENSKQVSLKNSNRRWDNLFSEGRLERFMSPIVVAVAILVKGWPFVHLRDN